MHLGILFSLCCLPAPVQVLSTGQSPENLLKTDLSVCHSGYTGWIEFSLGTFSRIAHTPYRLHTRLQDPFIQSVVSLTSSLVVKMLTVLVSTKSNLQVFLLKKCE